MIEKTTISTPTGSSPVPGPPKPQNEEEAARQFEEVLVRHLVSSMTENLFKQSLSGEDGPQWMSGYAETQRDVLTDALTDHLIESGTLKLSDMMLRQWNARSSETAPENE